MAIHAGPIKFALIILFHLSILIHQSLNSPYISKRHLNFKYHEECYKLEKSGACDENAICITHKHNESLIHKCHCISGYAGNGTYCEEINECKHSKAACPFRHKVCINVPRSYKCICYPEDIGPRYHRRNCSRKIYI
ncbi:uncharacterized protein TRIADDRAFT_62390 [Trichoplax adhaerens]|uniref:EGF-like domain-containing protein n=1 Tax=Trichoplax adhaerens TaxID=10228 RepID=B3SDN3_TRIAD|nr:hypothetical protein TRIADDRAFT_62390 [Trichoplax adhaerens]EDV19176.1 hypothetical protein TRIADDRAFT_62390 [Trichoplax adhaerens]|eukprot:XP_002118354.1 hypothetical protein TRIADDRAFT_62390 [Trichoplax adhaerens]